MKTAAKLVILVLLLNVVRYLLGGPLEAVTIMEPMHRVMPGYPEVFDLDFTTRDFAISFFYNFMLWFAATVVFHVARPALGGSAWLGSLKIFALLALFFCALAAVYMNHYTVELRPFYLWSMVDALILFPLVGLANGLLYPLFFPSQADRPPART